MVEQTVSTFGRLDAAYNNAGVQAPPSDMADEAAEEFDRVNAINLRGVWACMKHELRHMREQGSGAIVNCSSLGGLVGLPSRAAYHASKHGVIGLTRSAALEYAPRGIRINAVCPGIVETPMVTGMLVSQPEAMKELMKEQPIGRLGRPEEIAVSGSLALQPWRKLRDRSCARCRWRLHGALNGQPKESAMPQLSKATITHGRSQVRQRDHGSGEYRAPARQKIDIHRH